MTPGLQSPSRQVQTGLRILVDRLREARHPEGYWAGFLSSSALSTATATSALCMAASPDDQPAIQAGAAWLRQHQNSDGGWGDSIDSPSNLSTTLLAIAALELASGGLASCMGGRVGLPPEMPAGTLSCRAVACLPGEHTARQEPRPPKDGCPTVARAWQYVNTHAGSEPAQLIQALERIYGRDRTFAVPILMNCALAGMVPWELIPPLPFELAALPHSWYKALRLHVVSYALPALIAIGLLLEQRHPARNPLRRLIRRAATPRALAILRQIQPENGGFLEATPLTSFVAMSLAGRSKALAGVGSERKHDDPVTDKCLAFLRRSQRPDGSWPIDTNLSVWLTTSAVTALSETGSAHGIDLATTAGWIAGRQYTRLHPYTHALPGAWAWTDLPGGVPDVDDTAGAVIALLRLGRPQAIASAVQWLLQLQNDDGGWPTFCRGWGHLPFDKSAPDVTAHVLRALYAATGHSDDIGQPMGGRGSCRAAGNRKTTARQEPRPPMQEPRPPNLPQTTLPGTATGIASAMDISSKHKRLSRKAISRGLRYLHQTQQPDGSWLPLWFGNQSAPGHANPVLGTARVLRALEILDPAGPAAARGVDYLLQAQNADGGWGGATGIVSSMEETALAVSALSGFATTPRVTPATARGVDYLLNGIDDGHLDRPIPIGLYFASLWYSERLYPVIWTLEALARASNVAGFDKRNTP